MSHEISAPGEAQAKITEIVIRLSVLGLLLIWCFRILQPFLIPVVWGMIIAVAIHPVYRRLARLLGDRHKLAASLVTVMLLLLLMGPALMLTQLLVENVATLAQHARSEHLAIPLPPESVKEWPLIGDPVSKAWSLAATNLTEALSLVQPQLKAFGVWLVGIAASAGIGLIMFFISVIIAGAMLAHSAGSHRLVHGISRRLVGSEKGDEMADLAEKTIRSVTRGILGVAVIQALLAGVGFAIAGVPGAGIWALLCLISATVQLGVGPIVIPAVIYVFMTGDPLVAGVFLVWNAIILVLDNILKPLLLGRGVNVPMLVIFLGSIGGMLLMGIVGLFIGAVVLALGYTLMKGWMQLESTGQ
jgi:predicted PurR-regulated permease PerM